MYNELVKRAVSLLLFVLQPFMILLQHNFQDENVKTCTTVQHGYQCKPELTHHWGMYSPWSSVPSEIPLAIPDQCNVTFVQVLHRHGSRGPTFDRSQSYAATVRKIHENVQRYSEEYEFIREYQYALAADQLTPFGAQELVFSGMTFFERYLQLSKNHTPFIRVSDQRRVLDSANNWTRGFHLAKTAHDVPDHHYPYDTTIISEKADSNNTLHHGLCYRFDHEPPPKIKDTAKRQWLNIFAPAIQARVNKKLPGAKLSRSDIVNLMELCPFNTVALPEGKVSKFCDLFTPVEWEQFSYYCSLDKYYGFGAGNPLGPTQGVGYVNELVARLTNAPVIDHTSVNHTLDNDDTTFPIGKVLYADFGHDNEMTSIFFALGLYNSTKPLSNTTRQTAEQAGGFSASHVVPFASRAYIEKLQCADVVNEEVVRVIVNDRVIPLEACGGDYLGRCSLTSFIDSLTFARSGGRWDQCFPR